MLECGESMSERESMKLAASIASCAVLQLLAACAHDFDAYEPVGSIDASVEDVLAKVDAHALDGSPLDATDDACIPQETCISGAKDCGDRCLQTSNICQNACGNNQGCRNSCITKEKQCRAQCSDTCVACAACNARDACDSASFN